MIMTKENILLFCDNYFNDYKFLNNNFKEGTNVYLLLDDLNNKKIHQFFKEKQKKTKLIEFKDTDDLEENIEDDSPTKPDSQAQRVSGPKKKPNANEGNAEKTQPLNVILLKNEIDLE